MNKQRVPKTAALKDKTGIAIIKFIAWFSTIDLKPAFSHFRLDPETTKHCSLKTTFRLNCFLYVNRYTSCTPKNG